MKDDRAAGGAPEEGPSDLAPDDWARDDLPIVRQASRRPPGASGECDARSRPPAAVPEAGAGSRAAGAIHTIHDALTRRSTVILYYNCTSYYSLE